MRRLFVLMIMILAACQSATSTTISATPTRTNTSSDVETSVPQPTATSAPTRVATVPASTVELENAQVAPGFSLIKFATLDQPISFDFDSQGKMYVTSQNGNIYLLQDEDQDGRADSKTTFSSGFYFPLGVAVHQATGDIYVSHRGKISVLRDTNQDGMADEEKILIENLPIGTHQNNNLEFGPDGWLYMGVGSACKSCVDSDPRSATIMRFNIDTGQAEIYARGLRNAFDIAFQPETGNLFATDNGRDDLGMEVPFEELNQIVQGGDYGYPACWNVQDSPECQNTIPGVAFFEAHSSADGLDFYNGDNFPAEYRGNAFVSIFGSWLKPDVQTGIQRVVLSPSGDTFTGEESWFIRFPVGVMPLGVRFGPDGALYIGDYANGAIYRISYGLP